MTASSTLIQPERITNNIVRLRVQLPGHALGHMNSYVIQSSAGALLIDVGWNEVQYLEALSDVLAAELNIRIADVGHVLITHSHPDHLGAAGVLQHRLGATVAMSEREWRAFENRYEDLDRTRLLLADWIHLTGAPEPALTDLYGQAQRSAERVSDLERTAPRLPTDGKLHIAGIDLEVMETPGHTSGHSCFVLRDERIIFTGDHLLDRGTAGPGYLPPISDGDILDSLRSLKAFALPEGFLGLPGHGDAIVDVVPRARIVRTMHLRRMHDLLERIPTSGATAWQIASVIPRNAAWRNLAMKIKIAATAQAFAYLRALDELGFVVPTAPLWRRSKLKPDSILTIDTQ